MCAVPEQYIEFTEKFVMQKNRIMMDILNLANLEAHKGRPCTTFGKWLTLWRTSDNFLQCCIESQGCKFSKKRGACIMCDYGVGNNLTVMELEHAFENILLPNLSGVKTILFGSYGSVLDEYEISEECFNVILDFVARHCFESVIFETHYSTVTLDKLRKIKNAIGAKSRITIEMGYESCDEYILSNCLKKVLNLEELRKTIREIHNTNMQVSLNVFVGAPFVSTREQTLTSVKSVEWAFLNGADSVVIFPSNIKPFTLLYDLYKAGQYSEISQWQVIDVLNRIPVEFLDRVFLSWYGDKENIYEHNQYPLLPPKDCSQCHNAIFSFYQNFRNTSNINLRKKMLSNLLNKNFKCMCREKYFDDYEYKGERLSCEDIREIVKNVKNI